MLTKALLLPELKRPAAPLSAAAFLLAVGAPAADADTVVVPVKTATGFDLPMPITVTATMPDGSTTTVPSALGPKPSYGAVFDAPAGTRVTVSTTRNRLYDEFGCPAGFTRRSTHVTFTVGEPPPTLVAPALAPVLTDPSISHYERRAFEELNRIRAEAGVHPLRMSERLNMTADMIATANDIGDGCTAHLGRNGDGLLDRYLELGARTTSGHIGEIAKSLCRCQATPEQAARDFLNSTPHRDALLRPTYTHAGVAHVGQYLFVDLAGDDLELFAPAPDIPLRGTDTTPADGTGSAPGQTDGGSRQAKPAVLGASISTTRRGITVRGRVFPGRPGQTIKVHIVHNGKRTTVKTRTGAHGTFRTPHVNRAGDALITATVTIRGVSRTVRSR